jgi:pimeloyl-ACP methyl ester carboxylesterase
MVVRAMRVLAIVALITASLGTGEPVAAAAPVSQTGTNQGAAYQIDIPANWNGDLVLYSHGYVAPGSDNPAEDAGDPATAEYLLSHGYALAGSAYKTTGWAVQDALEDQINLLNLFDKTFGKPKHTIAWGHSLGGMITAGLVQRDPQRFAGALPMCGVLAGGVAVWNVGLDSGFVFKTLLAPNSGLQLVNIQNPDANLGLAETILGQAQRTPEGQARVALAAAVGDLPGWFTPGSPEPAAGDFNAREANQASWDAQVDFPFGFALRAELEQRAGGNPSWNIGVDYRRQLNQSVDRDEVEALYAAAGLNLDQDLRKLASAPRVLANPRAVSYLMRNIVFDGDIDHVPVLTMHTTDDGLVLNQDEQAYASIVDRPELLRQTFVHRPGHCTFTPAETIAAFNALVGRINTGRWSGVQPQELNQAAAALRMPFNTAPPAYVEFTPTRFPRPFSIGFDLDGRR